MNHQLLACLLVIAGLTACSDKPSATTDRSIPSSPAAGGLSGQVVETIDTAGYTYVLLDTGRQQVWAAAPQSDVKEGDTVTVSGAMPMPNYHSKSLDREFDLLYFASGFIVNGATSAAATEAASLSGYHGGPVKPAIDFSDIERLSGGVTVGEIVGDPKKLAGKPVALRGKVVKYNSMILGKNWVHVQDGTGSPGSDNLVVTTDSEVRVGDTVLVNGTVTTDKDFGSGYKYKVIIENGTVTVE
jgi:FtsP/CotA-like multicopper oxidase with cupredoxin domain